MLADKFLAVQTLVDVVKYGCAPAQNH